MPSPLPCPLPLRLGVNVDHVATLRNARGGARPDPVRAALLAIEAGADGITAHLREDRRHIRDADMTRLKAEISKPLNFEMAATEDMLRIALATKPHAVCLVPERREELTTEGGLDVVGQHNALAPYISRLNDAGVRVSLFIAADPAQIEMAARLRAPVIEIHTGAWCDAVVDGHAQKAEAEWKRIVGGAALARSAGLEVHAGHGLDYATAERIATLGEIAELNIGYFMMGEALFVGLAETVRAMRAAMDKGRASLLRGAGAGSPRSSSAMANAFSTGYSPTPNAPRPSAAPRTRTWWWRPMPNASRPRRPVPRRWGPASGRASGGATWA
jgi:pyridoxine 5-phosphate synthase